MQKLKLQFKHEFLFLDKCNVIFFALHSNNDIIVPESRKINLDDPCFYFVCLS